jgi:hypothetical protein
MSLQGQATSWNIAFSTSTYSNFGTDRRQEISLQDYWTSLNIASSTSPNSHIRPLGKIWVRRAIQPLEKLLSRHCPNRILDRSEVRKWLRRVRLTFKSWLSSLRPRSKFCASHKAENQFVGPDDLFLNLVGVEFLAAKKAENEFSNPSNALNIAFSTSPKSHFVPTMRQKMSSHGQTTHCNIALSTSPKLHFRPGRRQKLRSKIY